MPTESVVIIGAGPSGLSLAYELERRGIRPLVLERGDRPGMSWRRMYEDLRLGPWISSTLAGSRVGLIRAFKLVPRSEFVEYLDSYAEQRVSRLHTGVEVLEFRASEGGFELVTNQGVKHCRLLVNATGYFSNPYTPDIPGAATTAIPYLHSSEYRSAQQMRSEYGIPGRVLIVGARLSAGEMVLRLVDAGYGVDVSARRAVTFGRSLRLQQLGAPIYFVAETARVRWSPDQRRDSHRAMDGGRTRSLIRTGRVKLLPDVEVIGERTVQFIDGSQREYDLILFATGYKPHLEHFADSVTIDETTGSPAMTRMESDDLPGLFFLGVDNQRNFRSRFIRGIREDAGVLADSLTARLGSLEPRVRN